MPKISPKAFSVPTCLHSAVPFAIVMSGATVAASSCFDVERCVSTTFGLHPTTWHASLTVCRWLLPLHATRPVSSSACSIFSWCDTWFVAIATVVSSLNQHAAGFVVAKEQQYSNSPVGNFLIWITSPLWYNCLGSEDEFWTLTPCRNFVPSGRAAPLGSTSSSDKPSSNSESLESAPVFFNDCAFRAFCFFLYDCRSWYDFIHDFTRMVSYSWTEVFGVL